MIPPAWAIAASRMRAAPGTKAPTGNWSRRRHSRNYVQSLPAHAPPVAMASTHRTGSPHARAATKVRNRTPERNHRIMSQIKELLIEELQDLLHAENQLVAALP